jgi:hypothetical protein
MENLSELQISFNKTEKEIERIKTELNCDFGHVRREFLKTSLNNLQNKLYVISQELTAERHANNY